MATDYTDEDKEIIRFTQEHIESLKAGSTPNIVFHIARSKNRNIVMYEAKLDAADPAKFAAEPIDGYWHDMEPSYQAISRKKGIMHDRVEISWIEHKMAYGFAPTLVEDGAEVDLALVALPSRVMRLSLRDGKPVGVAEVSGKRCTVQFIFVKSVERTLLPPKCIYVDLYGTDLTTGETVVERITP